MTTIRSIHALRIALLTVTAVALTACGRNDGPTSAQVDSDAKRSDQQSPADATGSREMTPEQMEQSFSALATAVESVPRDAFEPQALAKTLEAKPEVFVAWVRDNTYWVPYRGAMRGPAGVLMDRVGNSLDRSLLLAELLRFSGRQVRLAHGDISAPDSKRLLAEVSAPFPAPAVQRALVPAAFPEEDIANYARQLRFDARQLSRALSDSRATYIKLSDEMSNRLDRQIPFLTQAAEPYSTGSDRDVRPVSALQDHWWVQLRDEESWVDLDATLSAEQRNAARIAAKETLPFDKPSGEIPLDGQYVHEITIRVIAEQWKAGRVKESVVLEHNFRPAELIGQPILFQNGPLNWELDVPRPGEGDPMEAFADRVLEQKEWLPNLIIGEQLITHYGVDESGELILDPASAGRSPGPGTVADALAGSESFGGDESAPQSDSQFTAEWIEYEIRVPGEKPSTIRRQIFDMFAGKSRAAQPIGDPAPNYNRRLQRALNLMGSIQILPMVSRYPSEFLAYQSVLQNLRNRDALVAIKKNIAEHNVAGVLEQVRRYVPTSVRLFDLSLARFEMSRVSSEVYLDSPNILSFRRTLDVNSQNQLVEEQGYDIVANSVAVSPKSRKAPFDVRLSQGVADTNAEALLIESAMSNAGSLLDLQRNGTSWVVLRKAEDIDALSTNWPTETRARLAESTQAGYIIIAPKSPDMANSQHLAAWWRIDPASGTTLGIDQKGRGGAVVETPPLTITGALQSAAYFGFLGGTIAFNFCIAKKIVQGKLFQEDKYGNATTDDYGVYADCGCWGLEAGASLGGSTFGALGGPKGIGWGLAVGNLIAKGICK
jgi:hypothetical protein